MSIRKIFLFKKYILIHNRYNNESRLISMCSFHLPWIPEFDYIQDKIKKPIKIGRAIDYIKEEILKKEIFKNSEILFWTILSLERLNKLEFIENKNLIKKYIIDLKHPDGGYKSSPEDDIEPDVCSSFYCIAVLKILGFENIIEEKDIDFIIKSQGLASGSDGGFIHCRSPYCSINCDGRPSIKSTLYALSILSITNNIDKIDKIRLLSYLRKSFHDDLDSIFQIFCLIILNELNTINIEKKASRWKILSLGFKINEGYPSIEYIYWASLCLNLINKLEDVEFEVMINFFKTMQQENGGFTNQYTSISTIEPSLLSTCQSILCFYLIWDELINIVEKDIILRSQDNPEIYFFPISKKYSIPLKLVKKIAIWLISNNWIDGKILDKADLYQNYFDHQNIIPQEIISKLMELIKTNIKDNEIDLNEFSKNFTFSNALERVKLVINDLIINQFLMGNIKSVRRKYILEDYAILGEYIQLNTPVFYREILNEKLRIKDAIYKIATIRYKLIDFINKNSQEAQILTEKEKILEAKDKVNQIGEFIGIKIRNFEGLLNQIKSSHHFVNSKLLLEKFDENWSVIDKYIEKILSEEKAKLVEIIKQKEKDIAHRMEEEKEMGIIKELNLNLEEIDKKFHFLLNLTEQKASKKLYKTIFDFVEQSNANMETIIKEKTPEIKLDPFKTEFNNIKQSWGEKQENLHDFLKIYQSVIDNGRELKNFINTRISRLQKLIEEKSIQIIKMINENKLHESSTLLDNNIISIKELFQEENREFYDKINEVEEKIDIFSIYTTELKISWDIKLNQEKKNWDDVAGELKEKIYSSMEKLKKDELVQRLVENVDDLKWLMNNMKLTTESLIKAKNLKDAQNKSKDLEIELNQRLEKYDKEFKDYIKISIQEFNEISKIEKELIKEWDARKKEIFHSLEEIKLDLAEHMDTTGSAEKKSKLQDLIRDGHSKIENELNKFELNYHDVLKFKKNIDKFEQKFHSDAEHIKDYIKTLDEDIKQFIKTESREFKHFNELILKELEFWDTTKLSLKDSLDSIYEKVDEKFFIKKVHYYVNAFKGKRIDLKSLSEMMKIKTKPLKLKLIDLISNSKLIGELDSTNNTLSLLDAPLGEQYSYKKSSTKEKLKKETDPTKRDILSLRYIIVVHTQVGATIYNRKLGDWQMEADLIGGFLSAIQDFSLEIKKKQIPIEKMAYKEFEIMLEQGNYVLIALFIDGKGSDWIREKQKLFVKKFEKYYESNLKNWRGELTHFSNAGYLVDEVFELYRV